MILHYMKLENNHCKKIKTNVGKLRRCRKYVWNGNIYVSSEGFMAKHISITLLFLWRLSN